MIKEERIILNVQRELLPSKNDTTLTDILPHIRLQFYKLINNDKKEKKQNTNLIILKNIHIIILYQIEGPRYSIEVCPVKCLSIH